MGDTEDVVMIIAFVYRIAPRIYAAGCKDAGYLEVSGYSTSMQTWCFRLLTMFIEAHASHSGFGSISLIRRIIIVGLPIESSCPLLPQMLASSSITTRDHANWLRGTDPPANRDFALCSDVDDRRRALSTPTD